MPDKLEKFRRKLDTKRRATLDDILSRIGSGDFAFLDMKKLEGSSHRYRIRKSGIRIQFSLDKNGKATEIDVDWRNEGTYSS